jgi:hypothetical protein
MSVTTWELTPWYLRIFGWPEYRRLRGDTWEYYDEEKHGRGLWVK